MHCSVAALFVALRDALSSGNCSGYYSGQYSGYCISLSSYTVESQLRKRRYKYVNFGAYYASKQPLIYRRHNTRTTYDAMT